MTPIPDKNPFNINDHFNALMKSIGIDPAEAGSSITSAGDAPILESRIRLGAANSLPYMGAAAAVAMIWKMRTGRGQNLKIDLGKAIHYIAAIPWSTLNGRPYTRGWTVGVAPFVHIPTETNPSVSPNMWGRSDLEPHRRRRFESTTCFRWAADRVLKEREMRSSSASPSSTTFGSRSALSSRSASYRSDGRSAPITTS